MPSRWPLIFFAAMNCSEGGRGSNRAVGTSALVVIPEFCLDAAFSLPLILGDFERFVHGRKIAFSFIENCKATCGGRRWLFNKAFVKRGTVRTSSQFIRPEINRAQEACR